MSQFSKETLKEVYWKSCSHEGYLNIYVYRKVALWWAVIAAKLKSTPNQVSTLSLVTSLIAAALFATGDYALMLWGLVPFHVGKILDCTDGLLARLTGQKSKLGAFLDPFYDRVVDIATLLALAVAHYAHTASLLGFWIVFAFVVAWFFTAYLEKESGGEEQGTRHLRQGASALPAVVRRLLKWDGGFTGLVITLAVVFWQIPAVLGLFLLVAALPLPVQFWRLYVKLRDA